MAPIVEVPVPDIFGKIRIMECPIGKEIMEKLHLESFKDKYQCLPEWNKQEGGRKCDWDPTIKKIRRAICDKKTMEYNNTDDPIFVELYLRKHKGINVSCDD